MTTAEPADVQVPTMNDSVLKKTQDGLGKVIKKPQLTAKVLRRPPFRFLHDVFSEVIRTTGFMKGLYSEADMNSENVKEKKAKMAYLQQAIDVVSLVSGESLSVKPSWIVAGHEPERTNELLQAIARCCLSKMSSDDAVRRVLSGEKPNPKSKASSSSSRSQKKENQDVPETAQDREKSKRPKAEESRERQENGDSEQRQRDREKSKKKGRGRVREREQPKDKDRKTREKEPDRERHERDREQPKNRDREDRLRDKDREKDQDRIRSKPREEDSPKPVESSPRIPAIGQRRRDKVSSQDESNSEEEAEATQKPVPSENSTVTAPAPKNEAAPRGTVCRSSARPATSRVKRQESNTESPAQRMSSERPAALILDGRRTEEDKNDEDEQFLVQEALPTAAAEDQDSHREAVEAEAKDKHGGLVKKILETKKYYEVSPSSPKTQNVVSGEVHKKERDLVYREIERLRSSVQTVCHSALLLGKIMEYIQEDMDSMHNELQQWRQENREHAQALLQEHRTTELTMQPLKLELAGLEERIQDQQAQICTVRFTILGNEEKIQRMVMGLQSELKT